MIRITSSSNSNIKYVLKLKMKKYREEFREYILEGFKLIEEAVKSNVNIREIFISTSLSMKQRELLDNYEIPVYEVEEKVFSKLSSMQHSEGILAIASFQEQREFDGSNILVLDRVQDPGNLGTMIRTADAAGFQNIICSRGTVDLYNEKTIRAAMGSLFHVNIIKDVDLDKEIEPLKKQGYIVVGTDLNADHYFMSLEKEGKFALIIGNEANGIGSEILEVCDLRTKIPIYGKAESLNASIAAGILMYHLGCGK